MKDRPHCKKNNKTKQNKETTTTATTTITTTTTTISRLWLIGKKQYILCRYLNVQSMKDV